MKTPEVNDSPEKNAVPSAPAPAASAAPETTAAQTKSEDGFMRISPRARHLAEKTDADLSKAVPTGPMGRIIERDINSLLDKGLTNSAGCERGAGGRGSRSFSAVCSCRRIRGRKASEYSPRNCKEYACFAFKYGSAYAQRHI